MQIVIDIPDKLYKHLAKVDAGEEPFGYFERIIMRGTPLPKGHGDLKDTEKLKKSFITWSMAVHGNFTDADIASIIYNSPTIIEAESEEEE